jgi:hypothetical protein
LSRFFFWPPLCTACVMCVYPRLPVLSPLLNQPPQTPSQSACRRAVQTHKQDNTHMNEHVTQTQKHARISLTLSLTSRSPVLLHAHTDDRLQGSSTTPAIVLSQRVDATKPPPVRVMALVESSSAVPQPKRQRSGSNILGVLSKMGVGAGKTAIGKVNFGCGGE